MNRRPTDYESRGTRSPERDLTVGEFLGVFTTKFAALQERPSYYDYPIRIITRLLGSTRLRELGVEQLESFRATRLGEGASRPTVNRNVAVLGRVLRVACEWGYIDSIPRVRQFRENPPRIRFLTPQQASALVAAVREDLRPFFLFLLHTGCRRGEALALKWEDVDLANRRATFKTTKNGSSRTVPLSASLTSALAALPHRTGRVFGVTAWGLKRPFLRALKEVGISNFRIHDLRHTSASIMAQAGISLQKIGQILGHKSFAMTMRYSHLQPAHLREGVEAIDAAARWESE